MPPDERPLLQVKELRTHFHTEEGVVRAVDGVSFSVGRSETVGFVGESGCGKTVTFYSIMRLLQGTSAKIAGGEVLFKGTDLLRQSEAQMRRIRGKSISMIYQEPMTSLNPVFTVGYQIMEAIILHQHLGKARARQKAIDLLDLVGIPSPRRRVDDYPFQLSGGMRQRVMLAIALSSNPELLIADEPTTALDVTIQAQILSLMDKLRDELGLSIILISHDLGIVAQRTDRVIVMYAGRIVEEAETGALFSRPLHPYTEGLLQSIPKLNRDVERLQAIGGNIPDPAYLPSGCKFHPRCPYAREICREEEPDLFEMGGGHRSRCWRCTGYTRRNPS